MRNRSHGAAASPTVSCIASLKSVRRQRAWSASGAGMLLIAAIIVIASIATRRTQGAATGAVA
ncbi:hypothetical protein IC232_19110 [Microvirga sp. BT688]|uniref:hypothetical protein n=1 Tax=Microvirga sp. TaxID=1873136 RepID=UPI001688A1C4|nr:hypothetical protein [Microvirga sp.]MBD2748802.1 hypothetical protein [Microvirga sp.]